MDLENIRENKVKVLLQFAVPSIIAMVLTAVITVADGFFIGNYVGEEGVAAVNLGLPVVYLYLALGLMVAVGSIAIAGMDLGAGDREHCNVVFNQTIVTLVIVSIIVSAVVFLCFSPMLHVLHVSGTTAEYFREYYTVMLFELPVMIINSGFGMFIRGEGNPKFFMQINIWNVLLNVLLDYLFAAHLGLGVTGIAVASLLSALVSLAMSIYYFMKKSVIYHFGRFTFDRKVLSSTLLNGVSEFVGEISMSISMFAYNYVIMQYVGVDGVTAFTLVGYIAYLFSMVVIGSGQGASPLISFAYGAGDKKLAGELRKKTNIFVFAAGVLVILFLAVGAGWYSGLFVKNEKIIQMVCVGVRIYLISFLFSGINAICSFYFTSIGKAKESAVISSARGLVILLICILFLPRFLRMNGVWLASTVTESLTFLICLFYLRKDEKAVPIKKLPR